MPASNQLDVRWIDDLKLPYDKLTKELDERPRLVDGQNMWVTLGGKLSNRPGTNDTGLTGYTVDKRPDRLVLYETLENPPKVYLLASFYNSSTTQWEMWYLRLDATTPAWTSLGTLRDIDHSTRPHEIVTARGLAFIKAYPGGANDKYGCVIFDGSGAAPSVKLWGLPAPTTAVAVSASSGWAAASNAFTVNFGWQYVYCWKSLTGQYSCRSPLATAPGTTSSTGAFSTKKPSMTVQGHVDTTNIPYIGIFRTTDGGGTFYFVEDITNTGAGGITYVDQHRETTNTNNPKTDMQLDTANIAPSLTSNLPPPPVGFGKTMGTDNVDASSNLAYYAGRIWYFIGNRLYFSGREEILNGVPEESFPSPNGIRGNYFIVQGQGRLLQPTQSGMIALTDSEVFMVVGEDRSNLRIIRLQSGIGTAVGHPRAITSYRDTVFFLSNDYQIMAVSANTIPTPISLPLGDAITSRIATGMEVCLAVHSFQGNLWLIVLLVNKTTSASTVVLVYDIAQDLWNVPWTIRAAAMAAGQYKETDTQKKLVFLTWNAQAGTPVGSLALLDTTIRTDAPAAAAYVCDATINLVGVPAGNHINALRKWAATPMISYLVTERTKFASDTEPTVEYRLDEFSGTLTTGTAFAPPFSAQHSSYYVIYYPINKAVQRVQVKLSKTAVNQFFELQNVGFVFDPEAGV